MFTIWENADDNFYSMTTWTPLHSFFLKYIH